MLKCSKAATTEADATYGKWKANRSRVNGFSIANVIYKLPVGDTHFDP